MDKGEETRARLRHDPVAKAPKGMPSRVSRGDRRGGGGEWDELLITLALGLLVAPLAADAQPSAKVPRIGFLRPRLVSPCRTDSFAQGLRELGYVEGQNSEHPVAGDPSRPLPRDGRPAGHQCG